MKRSIITLTALALTVAACAAATDEPPETTQPEGLPEGLDGIVLSITDEGGFVPVEFNLRRVPSYVLTSDGRLLYGAESNFGFPGPVISELMVTMLDDATVSDVMQFVTDLDLASIDEVDINNATNVADASTTTTRFFDENGEHRLSIYALGMESGGDARPAIVQSMINALAAAADGGEPYVPERIEIHVTSELGGFEQEITQPWPLDISPEEMAVAFGPYRCATLEGDDAAMALDAFANADPATTWDADGTLYAIVGRPLLPHLEGCG